MPIRSASCAETSRPVSRISWARDAPIRRGSRYETPSSVPVSPLLIPAPRKVADAPAMRMSAPNPRHMPPP